MHLITCLSYKHAKNLKKNAITCFGMRKYDQSKILHCKKRLTMNNERYY